MESENELNNCQIIWKTIIFFLYVSVYFLLMLGWILVCTVYVSILFVGLIPVYLLRGSYMFLKECCKNGCQRAILPILIWLVLLPISSIFFALVVFCWDTNERRNKFIWRFCCTASCTDDDD